MIKWGSYTVLFFLVLSVRAQTEYRFKNLSINDGLSQSSVTSIVQDELHALWVGTQDGLNRYDGRSFEVFTSDDTEGLENEHINCSHKDTKGVLWFGTANGLTSYDLETEKFQTFRPENLSTFFVQDLAEDKGGYLWIASTEYGLYRFDKEESTFLSFKNTFPKKRIVGVEIYDEHKLIISTEGGELFLFNPDSKKIEELSIPLKVEGALAINRITLYQDNKVIIGTSQGAFELDLDKKEVYSKFNELDSIHGLQNISDAYQQHGIGWLLCTSNGLFTLIDDGKIVHCQEDIFQKTALLYNELNVVFRDDSGMFWIGSQRGISSFNPIHKGILGVGPNVIGDRGIPTASVWSFAENRDGSILYIGTDKAVSKLNKKTGTFTQYYREKIEAGLGTGESSILAIETINENKLLIGCTDGLFELIINGKEYTYRKVTDLETSNIHNRVYSIAHWKEQKYWIATRGGALLYEDGEGIIGVFQHKSSNINSTISPGVCRYVFKDRNGQVWFTTSTGGLNVLRENAGKPIIKPYKYNSVIHPITTDYITSIYQEKKGVYWFGTSGSGLMKWNEQKRTAQIFNKSNGLPNDVIYSVVPGENGTLWLSTNKGLSNFDPNTQKARNYTEVDGLMSNEFNLGAFMQSTTGVLYFGGIYGYNYFHPKELLTQKHDIDVVFTRFKLENEWLTPSSDGSPLLAPIFQTNDLYLNYKQHSFTLKFQSSDLSNPEQVNYKYILEGSDEGEVLIGTVNEIHFSALSHGDYTLKVYARFGKGEWSSMPAQLHIVISAPFWLTWWFWLTTALILTIAIRVTIRVRVEAARRDQVKLEMKIRDRTREIKKQNKKIESQKKKIEEERNKVIRQQELLQIEKDKTERLLKNVMPESTAEELKKRGKARARAYKTVSVIFTDFVGFTQISDRMSATELVKKLDVYFTKFDEIIVKNNLEKIKTIGDAYMCAGGVPVRNNTNPIDACLAAVQIQAYMLKRKNDAIANGREYWQLRLGINTGEVTAGVIGSERLAYDIWGATVNQAQRMEMLGEPEKVTITGATFKHIEPYFECSFLGKAQSKSRGLIDMYVVERIKPELSLKGEGVYPNKRFRQVVNLHHYSKINYYKAERHIMKVLEQRLSKKLHYHSIGHTKDVVKAVERLALLEGVTDEGLFLLKSAATYHDAGFVEQYENNEPIGARLAEEILPKYGYTEKHIDRIKELIFVTEIPHQPKNQLEEIICDADLDYLGRDDFHEIADKLRIELKEHGKIDSDRKWDEIQIQFLTAHKYFTKTAQKTRNKKKAQNLQEIKDRLKKDDYVD